MFRSYLGKILTVSALAALLGVSVVSPAAAEVSEETTYVFNTLLFLMAGFLVMWMAAGFCMLESGLVRSKNVTMQSLKNMALYSIACLLYLLVGYGFMYPGDFGGYIGFSGVTSLPAHDAEDITYASVGSDFFFQLVFCAATASIVSGTVAERIKLWPFLAFTVILTGFIYPIQGSWTWGGGWLSEMGFSDFAGSTIVHSVGGWAALTGAIILGARKGKYGPDGKVHPMPGSNLTLATLGTFILWLGWFGFNGGSQLAMGSLADVSDVSRIFANTNTAAAAGALAALILTAILYKKPDLTMVLNGALAGLVAITAEPLAPSLLWSIVVGAVGGVIVVITVPLLDKLKIDDVVGAIPVHLFAGIWGTIAVVFSNGDANIVTQIIGIVAIGAFVAITSAVFWLILKAVMGLRPTEEEEELGLDQAELGMEAYPEFGRGSQSL
jgi:Amt family ammonium transporter